MQAPLEAVEAERVAPLEVGERRTALVAAEGGVALRRRPPGRRAGHHVTKDSILIVY